MKNEKADIEKYISYKLGKSNKSLRAASLMIENKFYNEAINRIYYAYFYVVTAILFKNNIDAKTHAGVRTMMHKHLVQHNLISQSDGAFYSDIFEYRHSSDYDDYVEFEKDVVEKLFIDAEKFTNNLHILLTQ
jgi:uncharacterized protein (UPF0332 family)